MPMQCLLKSTRLAKLFVARTQASNFLVAADPNFDVGEDGVR
jgi:hypothetical protein